MQMGRHSKFVFQEMCVYADLRVMSFGDFLLEDSAHVRVVAQVLQVADEVVVEA